MGRKTYESIPEKFRPLQGRENIIITRNTDWSPHNDIHIVNSVEDSLKLAKTLDKKEVFILGGAQIFNETIDMTDRIYLTIINGDFDADTFFPDYSQFSKIIEKESHEQDGFSFNYITLDRG